MKIRQLRDIIARGHDRGGPLFRSLIVRYPPARLRDRRMYETYLEIVGLLATALGDQELNPEQAADAEAYIEAVGPSIAEYEADAFHLSDVKPRELVRFLMEQSGLSQVDLAGDFGGQPNVSAFLAGRRKLNAGQIARLAHRFRVSADLFHGRRRKKERRASFGELAPGPVWQFPAREVNRPVAHERARPWPVPKPSAARKTGSRHKHEGR